MNGGQEVSTAVAKIEQIGTATLTELDGVQHSVADLDELLGILSHVTRGLSSAAENLPGSVRNLRVNEPDGSVAPGFVCGQVANHLQAAATGIDQARTAVSIAHRLSLRLDVAEQ
jgi:hypothetical protein